MVSTPGLSQALTLSTVPPTATPYNTFVPVGTSRPGTPTPSPGELGDYVSRCLIAGPDAPAEAAIQLPNCMASGSYTVTAEAVAGKPTTVLVDVTDRCFWTISFIAWDDSGWHVQSVEPFLNEDRGSYINAYERELAPTNPLPDARLIEDGGATYLGAIHLDSGCGSGPHDGYLLLRLDGATWHLA
jgi:hypothetical protein